jgi:sensor c-di-GMP phosphodiesterase-like protein
LKRFWQLRSLLAFSVSATVVLSVLIAGFLASRSAQRSIENSARRAVLNAERLIDRTGADLQKLDALSGTECDAAVQAKLKDAVYGAVSQIREIGLIKGETLYCTNFGPTNVNMAPVKDSLKVGTFISVGPNAVIANNSSLFVYTSRQDGLSINAVINPAILAEFERSSSLSGRAYLELKYTGTSANGVAAETRDLVYDVGQRDVKVNGDDFLEGEYKSSRYPIHAEIRADQGIFWDEYWPTLRYLLAMLFPLLLVVALQPSVKTW